MASAIGNQRKSTDKCSRFRAALTNALGAAIGQPPGTGLRRTNSQKAQQDLIPAEVLKRLQRSDTVCIVNPNHSNDVSDIERQGITRSDIEEARQLLDRARPLFTKLWPDDQTLKNWEGLIESPLTPADNLRNAMGGTGTWLLKRDDDLPVAGSIKGRGAFFAVLEHAEKLAIDKGLIAKGQDLGNLCSPEAKAIFSDYKIAVGSTGNLGMGIALLAAALGFDAEVHLSEEAADWKKKRLTDHGCKVFEHDGNFKEALQKGRDDCAVANQTKPGSAYFVDDEDSKPLSVGPTVAGLRMKEQLQRQGISIGADRPLFVYIPTGVGGGPSGVLRGLVDAFQDEGLHKHVHGILVQPKQCASVLARMSIPDKGNRQSVDVYHLGLNNKSPRGDGMAVPQASELAFANLQVNAAGAMTVSDEDMLKNTAHLHKREGIIIETTAAASINGPRWCTSEAGLDYIRKNGMEKAMPNAVHVMWFTGGGKVPEDTKAQILHDAYQAIGEPQPAREEVA
ncbi:MAG TPA: D-serine ammonia-lyase [Burkholderiaceae bacterium]|nr:D-serine ammonia-lyase [Burkholderiaceae bacterium]